jgi:hypothetical protein
MEGMAWPIFPFFNGKTDLAGFERTRHQGGKRNIRGSDENVFCGAAKTEVRSFTLPVCDVVKSTKCGSSTMDKEGTTASPCSLTAEAKGILFPFPVCATSRCFPRTFIPNKTPGVFKVWHGHHQHFFLKKNHRPNETSSSPPTYLIAYRFMIGAAFIRLNRLAGFEARFLQYPNGYPYLEVLL